jgi:MmoB/DmpM family
MMTEEIAGIYDRVGPVLQAGTVANAIIAAIKDLNQDVMVVDRGAYVRVLVPQCCVVTRSAIEKHLGRPFRFPGELETVMSAFKGSLQLNRTMRLGDLPHELAIQLETTHEALPSFRSAVCPNRRRTGIFCNKGECQLNTKL